MDSGTLAFLLPVVMQWQLCAGENEYCQEAVDSVAIVDFCPTSKTEWDAAARRKNCSKIASTQKCSPADKFVYHCVINGYRNETLEVCAPSRIIFGRCVEFNVGGGVIQDQRSAPCSDPFPKCNAIYDSWTAYKFPDCYQLVSMGQKTSSTTVSIPTTTTTGKYDSLSVEHLLSIIAAVVFVLLLAVSVGVLLCCKRNQGSTKSKFEESTEDSGHDESDEMHQLDEMQGKQTKNHTTDTGKLHQPVMNNSHELHDNTPLKETGLP